jgi:hypothetical protein
MMKPPASQDFCRRGFDGRGEEVEEAQFEACNVHEEEGEGRVPGGIAQEA